MGKIDVKFAVKIDKVRGKTDLESEALYAVGHRPSFLPKVSPIDAVMIQFTSRKTGMVSMSMMRIMLTPSSQRYCQYGSSQ